MQLLYCGSILFIDERISNLSIYLFVYTCVVIFYYIFILLLVVFANVLPHRFRAIRHPAQDSNNNNYTEDETNINTNNTGTIIIIDLSTYLPERIYLSNLLIYYYLLLSTSTY